MGTALRVWHRLHATGHLLRGLGLAVGAATVVSIALVAGLLRSRGLVDHDQASVAGLMTHESSEGSALHLPALALDLARAEARLAEDFTPANALAVARGAWRLACMLPSEETELRGLLLDRAADMLADQAVIDRFTTDDRRMKALIEILRRPVVDLPSGPLEPLC